MHISRVLTAEQVSEILGVSRHRVYSAIAAGVVKPDVLIGRTKGFRGFSLSTVLDRLKPYITVKEWERAQTNLKLNRLPTTQQEAAAAAANHRRLAYLYFS